VSEKQNPPTSLIEAITYFSDLDVATEFVASLRWADGWHCPDCGFSEYSYLTTRRLWKCKGCKRQTSVKVGTIFEDSPLPLSKWLPAVWLIANSKNGISSHELARALGITQKSAWFMLHRIRLAMQTGSFEKFDGEVEVDEVLVGPKKKYMHNRNPKKKLQTQGGGGKTIVQGVKERGGEVRAMVVDDRGAQSLQGTVHDHVVVGSTVYTDKLPAYRGLGEDFDHATIDHATHYVEDNVHVNGLENFWALLRRGLHGTYVSVAPQHLGRYLDERMYTFNERTLSDLGRFSKVLTQAVGRRLTWEELTA
jgi:transposase-like protein